MWIHSRDYSRTPPLIDAGKATLQSIRLIGYPITVLMIIAAVELIRPNRFCNVSVS